MSKITCIHKSKTGGELCGGVAYIYRVLTSGKVQAMCQKHTGLHHAREGWKLMPAPKGKITEGDRFYIGSKPHPHHVMPGTMGRAMLTWSRRIREVAHDRGITPAQVVSQL